MSGEPERTMSESQKPDYWTTPDGLQELERLNNWATPGEWYRHQTDLLAAVPSPDGPDEEETRGVAEWIDVADAELVVACRKAVPELVAALKESWRRQAQLEERLRWIADLDDPRRRECMDNYEACEKARREIRDGKHREEQR